MLLCVQLLEPLGWVVGAVGNPAGVGFLTLPCAQHEGHVRQCHSLPGSSREKRKGVQLSPPHPDFRHCTQLKERELRSASGWPLSLHRSITAVSGLSGCAGTQQGGEEEQGGHP